MGVRLVAGQSPFKAGDGIEITADKTIQLLLRDENNLIEVNDDKEAYVDLQLAEGIKPTDDFPVGVTVGRVLSADGWYMSGTMLNFKTTSGDYGRWIYGTDGHIYYDHGTGTFTQIYSSPEVDALFTQLRNQLATVAFTGDYNDLINRPEQTPVYDGQTIITQNGTRKGTITANQSTNQTIELSDTTYPNMTAGEVGTGTDTTPMVISPAVLATYVNGKVSSVYKYKGSVTDYARLPTTGLTVGDVYNVATAHTTEPKFEAGTNVAWTGSERDPLAGNVDLSNYVTLDGTETITGQKTFTQSPIVPNKTTDATNTGTAIATEAQVYKVSQSKQSTLTAGENIDITNNVVKANNYFIITEDEVTVTTDSTKGVDPYSTSYGYTNITINNSNIEWIEGAVYTFVIDTKMVATSTYRNVRVRIGESGAWLPVMGSNAIISGYTYFTKANMRQYQYSTKYQSGGALHLFSDSNTTYSTMTTAEATTGTATSARTISASVLKGAIQEHAPVQSVNGDTGDVNITIPTVNDKTITYKQAGDTIGTSTTNQSSDSTLNFKGNLIMTQTEYNNTSGASTDGNFYFIYNT